jgi:hypothetical protein
MKKSSIKILTFIFLLLSSLTIQAHGWGHRGGVYHSFYRSHQCHYYPQHYRPSFSIFAPLYRMVFIPGHWEGNIFIQAHWERVRII